MKRAISKTVLMILRNPEARKQFDNIVASGVKGTLVLNGQTYIVSPTGNSSKNQSQLLAGISAVTDAFTLWLKKF